MHYIARPTAALVLGAAVLAGASATSAASASTPRPTPTPSPVRPAGPCPSICTMIYQPVRCLFDNGVSLAFGNICQARAYACDRRVRIVACAPRETTSAAGPAA
jgi:hypothetical protein